MKPVLFAIVTAISVIGPGRTVTAQQTVRRAPLNVEMSDRREADAAEGSNSI